MPGLRWIRDAEAEDPLMGLDTTHDCWHGPYSSFDRLRIALQRAAGWSLEEDSRGYLRSTVINWATITDANIMGEWDAIPEDPLVVLIAHSDCDGQIPVAALLPLAERLEGLAATMTPGQGQKPEHWLNELGYPERPARATYDGEREATLRFAAGLRRAAALGETVEFG
jgi:hypothetical protein